jgi:signal transduction histidine kinase
VGKRFRLLPAGLSSRSSASPGAVWSGSGDGILPGKRVVSYPVLENAPFVVVVSRSRSDALEEWQRTAAGAAVAMVALSVVLSWFLLRVRREQAAREYERQRRVQADKLEALGQLTAGIAHDFGNMLNVVAMGTNLLRGRSVEASVFDQTLGGIERSVMDGKRLIERLMSFARRRPLKLAPLGLDAWLREARPLLAQAAGSRVRLDVDAVTPVPEVMCDVGQLDIALVNLVVNARDAMAGAGKIGVRVFPCGHGVGPKPEVAGAGAGFVCLTVEDNGPGMSDEVKRHAFEPFYTTKGEAGTGLGLPQVYGFMQQLGGTMTLDSAPGGGTAVNLFFPVVPPGSPAGKVEHAPQSRYPS